MRITSQIKKLCQEFPTRQTKIVEGYHFNQYETLKKIELYANSQFETGPLDSQGFYKFFYNINQFPCDIEAKATDIDTKDYVFVPELGRNKDILGSFLMKKELDVWAKEKKWGQKLNEIVTTRPKYGSVVVKKIKNDIQLVNLHNLVNDPGVKYLWQGPVIENHVWTQQELEDLPYDYEAKERVVNLYSQSGEENEILGREFYGWVNLKDIDPKLKDKTSYCMVICAGVEKTEVVDKNEVDLGIVLYWQEIKAPTEYELGDFPYRENHRRRIPGRWLGVGKTEELFDPQIRMNELQNIKSKGLYNSALQIYQSRDATVARNILEDLVNGEILKVDSEITPVNTAKVDLGAFQQEEQRWDKNIQERSFSFEAESGQSMPSGTPFRLGALLAAKSGGFFNLMREDMGLFLADLFYEVMIPMFKKDKRKKHVIMFPSDEKGIDAKINELTEWMLQEEINNGQIPKDLEQRRQAIKSKMIARGYVPVEIPDSYYDDIKAKIKLVITDEQLDLGQKMESISSILQIIAGNPSVLTVEPIRNLIFGAMQMAGVNPSDYGLNAPIMPQQMMQPQMPQTQGGAPSEMSSMPVPGQIVNQTTA